MAKSRNNRFCGACRMFSGFYSKMLIGFRAEKTGYCRALQKIMPSSGACAEFCRRAPARTGLTRKMFGRALEDVRFLEAVFKDTSV